MPSYKYFKVTRMIYRGDDNCEPEVLHTETMICGGSRPHEAIEVAEQSMESINTEWATDTPTDTEMSAYWQKELAGHRDATDEEVANWEDTWGKMPD